MRLACFSSRKINSDPKRAADLKKPKNVPEQFGGSAHAPHIAALAGSFSDDYPCEYPRCNESGIARAERSRWYLDVLL